MEIRSLKFVGNMHVKINQSLCPHSYLHKKKIKEEWAIEGCNVFCCTPTEDSFIFDRCMFHPKGNTALRIRKVLLKYIPANRRSKILKKAAV